MAVRAQSLAQVPLLVSVGPESKSTIFSPKAPFAKGFQLNSTLIEGVLVMWVGSGS